MNRMRLLVQTVTGKGLSFGNLALKRTTQTTQVVPFPDSEELKTLRTSLDALRDENQRFASAYLDLAVFAPNEELPRAIVERLWKSTTDLTDEEINILLYTLARQSLIEITNFGNIVLSTLHHNYLKPLQVDHLPELHSRLLDSYELHRWAELSWNETYLWDHLSYHLIEAGRRDEFIATIKDMAFLSLKTYICNSLAVQNDLVVAKDLVPGDLLVQLLHVSYINMKDAFNVAESLQEIVHLFLKQFGDVDALQDACDQLKADLLEAEEEQAIAPAIYTSAIPRIRPFRTLLHAAAPITCCAISPDGSWVVAGSKTDLLICDAQNGTLWTTLKGHRGIVQGCAISPDGAWIASAAWDNTVRIWDSETGSELITLYGHKGWVNDCAISPDGTWLVSASQDGTLKVWDALTGSERLTLEGHSGWVNACAISPNGKWIVSASQDGTLKLWNSWTGDEIMTLEGHSEAVSACAIDPQGEWIVSTSHDKTVKVWEVLTGHELFTVDGFDEIVTGCVVSPDSDLIITTAHDETLKIIDAETGEIHFSLEGHNSWVSGCAISPGGYLIVSSSWDKTLKAWKI